MYADQIEPYLKLNCIWHNVCQEEDFILTWRWS